MKLKTIAFLTLAAACALSVSAQSMRRRGAVGADGGKPAATGRDAYVTIDVPARPGGTCLASAPNLQANGKLLPPLGGRPRQWIVLETKYTTMAKWQDELTFTWHVLLDSSKAKEKDPRNLPAPYSYYTTQVRYVDIKKGSHMASVCLPPSVLERFGEPCTVSLIISQRQVVGERQVHELAEGRQRRAEEPGRAPPGPRRPFEDAVLARQQRRLRTGAVACAAVLELSSTHTKD